MDVVGNGHEESQCQRREKNVRVGAGVGHGQKEGLVVGELEVLVGELLAVDGLATSALWSKILVSDLERIDKQLGRNGVEINIRYHG